MWVLFLAGCATFAMVFCRGLQQKNVHTNNYKAAFLTSYLQSGIDVAVMMFVIKNGWAVVPWTGTGGALGIVTAMWFHNRYLNKPE